MGLRRGGRSGPLTTEQLGALSLRNISIEPVGALLQKQWATLASITQGGLDFRNCICLSDQTSQSLKYGVTRLVGTVLGGEPGTAGFASGHPNG